MNKKLYWGLGVLFGLIIGGFVFLLVQQKAELAKLKEDFALPTEKVAENENNQKTPQNGHWHGDEWHDEPHEPIIEGSAPVKRVSSAAYQNNGTYIDVDYSFLDNPEEAIRRHAEIKLNPENYSRLEYDTASQEALILIRKISDGYYGSGEYRDQLRKFRQEVYADPVLAKRGLSVDKLRKMVRGEIPPMIIPIDPIEFSDAVNGGESK